MVVAIKKVARGAAVDDAGVAPRERSWQIQQKPSTPIGDARAKFRLPHATRCAAVRTGCRSDVETYPRSRLRRTASSVGPRAAAAAFVSLESMGGTASALINPQGEPNLRRVRGPSARSQTLLHCDPSFSNWTRCFQRPIRISSLCLQERAVAVFSSEHVFQSMRCVGSDWLTPLPLTHSLQSLF